MLEKMADFFECRLDGYDEHMLNHIASAKEFYPFTAGLLPRNPGCRLLDLGCGTGLELEFYEAFNPSAHITGIDLSEKMLEALKQKFPDKQMELIVGSYFDYPLGEAAFDAAVSVESLHHFTMEQKIPLYQKIHCALKENGYFVLTDYFSLSDAEEEEHYREFLSLKQAEGINDAECYHFDIPLTVEHECLALREAGFGKVDIVGCWGATYTLLASY